MNFKTGITALAAVGLHCAAGASANAADMGQQVYKAAPMVAPGFNWTGFYLGAVGGYA